MKENKEKRRQIVYNAVTCNNCYEHIISYHRHDFKKCSCENETFVDGGMSYLHYGGKNKDLVHPVTVYADDNFEVVRKAATRGSRGKDGNQPLKWIPICEMSDEYIGAVLQYGAAGWHLELLCKELQYRREHGITITETETDTCADSTGNDGYNS